MTETNFIEKDILVEMTKVLNLKFASWLGSRFFQVEAGREADDVLIDVILMNSSKTYYYPVSARMETNSTETSPLEAAKFLVAYIESYFEEFFNQDEELWLPIDWKEYDCEGVTFHLKGQVKNVYVDDLADRMLAGETISEEELKGLRISNN